MAKNETILPGDLLGVEEEVGVISNTYVENGEVYSSVYGRKAGDARQMQVKPVTKSIRKLVKGDLVLGKIIDVFDTVAMIEIESEDDGERKVGETIGFLKITEIARDQGYIENYRDYYRIGDYIRARILDVTTTGTYLTTADPDLGVVKAYCSRCRKILKVRGNVCVCSYCGSKENRKLAALQKK